MWYVLCPRLVIFQNYVQDDFYSDGINAFKPARTILYMNNTLFTPNQIKDNKLLHSSSYNNQLEQELFTS